MGPKVPRKLVYFGGPVMNQVRVYGVFWDSNVDTATKSGLSSFLRAMVSSEQYDSLAQYNTRIKAIDGRNGTHQNIEKGTFGGNFILKPKNTNKLLDDTEIRLELESQLEAHSLPLPDENTIYLLYFPPGYRDTHRSTKFGNIFYGVIPDLGSDFCIDSCQFGGVPFDSVTFLSSNIIVNTVTSPLASLSEFPGFPAAWVTERGESISVQCGARAAILSSGFDAYIVQSAFSNASNSCEDGIFKVP
jgi:hypothetical protein